MPAHDRCYEVVELPAHAVSAVPAAESLFLQELSLVAAYRLREGKA